MHTTYHDICMQILNAKYDISTKIQNIQSLMERCMLGITRKDQKRLEWTRQKTPVIDVIHRI